MSKNETLSALKAKLSSQSDEIKHLKSKLALSHSAFLNIVGKSLDGVIILDQNKMVVYTNYTAIKLFDRNIADLLGEPLDIDFNPKGLVDSDETTAEILIPKVGGNQVICEVSVLKTEWNNEACYVVSFRDITERKKTEEILEHMSTHDYLTDLANRAYFERLLEQAIQRPGHQPLALIYLDLDHFKMINDTFGHVTGDQLLKAVSAALLQCVQPGDVVARLGGDEFALILNSIRNADDAVTVSKTILSQLRNIFYLEGNEVSINASIGIAVYPYGGSHAAELLKNADLAMYVAKSKGKDQYQIFSGELSQQSIEHLHVLNGLRHVIPNQELFIEYQPIIDLKTLLCCGVEALVRWRHPTLGVLFPDHFLFHAERAGVMPSFSRWIIKQVFDDYERYHLESLKYISINLSATDFSASLEGSSIFSYLNELELPNSKLIIELTESAFIHHPELILNKFNHLKEQGIRIAIDDYGTGYSSLSLLKQLPVSIMKIDKSFIADIGTDSNDRIIVNSTIQLAHNLGLKVVAEGVETEEQLDFLKKHNCDYIQGNYFSKPLEIKKLKAFLERPLRKDK